MKKITICFSINSDFFLYLFVTIQSLLDHINSNYKYEIVIFYTDLNELYKSRFDTLKNEKNIYFRFVDISGYLSHIDNSIFHAGGHITKESYYRIFIPRILKDYDKVLYLDADMIILRDISSLFEEQMADNEMILATKAIAVHYMIIEKDFCKFRNQRMLLSEYLNIYLNMKKLDNYFNAGMILFDIKKCLEFDLEKKSLDKLRELKSPIRHDQDILNSVLNNHVKIVDLVWNYTYNTIPKNKVNDYTSETNAIIWHFILGSMKPWKDLKVKKAEMWWQYARKTPFYEEILLKTLNQTILDKNNLINSQNNQIKSLQDGIQKKPVCYLSKPNTAQLNPVFKTNSPIN